MSVGNKKNDIINALIIQNPTKILILLRGKAEIDKL